ncbi:MAG: hypothetical protein PHX14_07070 [Syntrophomonadaceae bacterium]|nr:hypothetical protein [Syntrophomonadaceae bacterium]
MNSNKKLSQIKSFVKGKVYEFLDVLDKDLLNNINLSHVTIYPGNYTYGSRGRNLFAMKLKPTMDIDFEELEDELTEICIVNKLGLYVSIDEDDEGEMELQFFNKAVNNHFKSYQLMLIDEREYIDFNIEQLLKSRSPLVRDNIAKLETLLSLSKSIYMELHNNLLLEDSKDLACDAIQVGGLLKSVNYKTVTLEDINIPSVDHTIKINDDWKFVRIEHWGKNIPQEITVSIVA